MKKYSDSHLASISMFADDTFITALEDLFSQNEITKIVETGTFLGLGSTTFLAKAILKSKKKLPEFITIEVDSKSYKKAVKNLAQYPFITPKWGLSVSSKEAKEFILNDDAILNHQKYPDLFIDDVSNPTKFYLNEIEGKLSQSSQKPTFVDKLKKRIWTSEKNQFEDNIFQSVIPEIQNDTPLFLLDSAGGLGYLEFQKVNLLMNGHSHFLILDDTHHLKHFRSCEHIYNNKNYTLIAENRERGWLIAKFSAHLVEKKDI
jgi:hypothetical protein